jgi:hypothetical protein
VRLLRIGHFGPTTDEGTPLASQELEGFSTQGPGVGLDRALQLRFTSAMPVVWVRYREPLVEVLNGRDGAQVSTGRHPTLSEALRRHGFSADSMMNTGCYVRCNDADVDRVKLLIEVHCPGAALTVGP